MARRSPVQIATDVYGVTLHPLAGRVYFVRSGASWTLVDAATDGQSARIRAIAASLFGRDVPPSSILLTHVHPDHAGSALALARAWSCPVYLHSAEMQLAEARDLASVERYATPLDRWLVLPVMRLLPRRRADAMVASGSLEGHARPLPLDGSVPGLPDWRAVACPGHSPGHVAFHRPRDGVLISGDALLTVDLGSLGGVLRWIVRPGSGEVSPPPAWLDLDHHAALRSAADLIALRPRVLAPGHGPPVSGAQVEHPQRGVQRRWSPRARSHGPRGSSWRQRP